MEMQSEIYNDIAFEPAVESYRGYAALSPVISKKVRKGRPLRIGVDGYLGTDWESILQGLIPVIEAAAGIQGTIKRIATAGYMKSPGELKPLYDPYIENGDPVFGRVFPGDIAHIFRSGGLCAIKSGIKAAAKDASTAVVICYGEGALSPSLSGLYDIAFYFDATREKVYRESKKKAAELTGYISDKFTYYIGFPSRDKHRASAVKSADYYAECSNEKNPVFLPRPSLMRILDKVSSTPFRVKPLYYPGVWGGQWILEKRGITGLRNCAYAFEIIAPEQSVILRLKDDVKAELPFTLLHDLRKKNIMSRRTIRTFGGEFPIRFAYDDTWQGGNLSIQVHPAEGYMKRAFGEKMCQAETYYILDAKPGGIVHLGLTEDADIGEFRRAAESSEKEGKEIDHLRFVQRHPAKKGDLFLIPPGTVHGAGADEIVLEISSTPYRYTFKIYDYRRPDLDGTFRPLSVDHAFNVLNPTRRGTWVKDNLIASPKLLKEEHGNKEFVLLDSPDFPHRIHTVEFSDSYADRTETCFHMINLIQGDMVGVVWSGLDRIVRRMAFSETLLIPKSLGSYRVVNLGKGPCVVIKSFVR